MQAVLTKPACIAEELVCALQYWEVIILEHGYMRCTVSATSLTCEVGAACCLLPDYGGASPLVVHPPTAWCPLKFLAALAHADLGCDHVHAWEALQ